MDGTGGTAGPSGLTPVQWLICGIACLGFAFDLYESLMLPLIVRPALTAVGNLKPGTSEFNMWVGLLFYVPNMAGGLLGLLGGYLTDLFGRRRVLFWSILLYSLSACAAGFSTSLSQLLILRCTTMIGVCVEFVAAIAWLAELFTNARRRESVLGYTQGFHTLGGLMVTGAYYVAVTYAERLPMIRAGHEAWRYTLLSGLIPAIPLLFIRPFLPESPLWLKKRSKNEVKRPAFRELFGPALRKTTLVAMLLFACTYFLSYGALQQTVRMIPGLRGRISTSFVGLCLMPIISPSKNLIRTPRAWTIRTSWPRPPSCGRYGDAGHQRDGRSLLNNSNSANPARARNLNGRWPAVEEFGRNPDWHAFRKLEASFSRALRNLLTDPLVISRLPASRQYGRNA
jgi:MFS family permease